MSSDSTLIDTAREYLASLSDKERIASQAEVERFARWCGADRTWQQVRAQDVANYAETFTGSVADASQRADAVRRFLAYAKKAGLTPTNMGSHLRLRKGAAAPARGVAHKEVQMSQQERDRLDAELASLKAQRPRILQDIQRAMEDKDFRENAPLDAARQQKAYIEGRIRELEATLDRAVLVEERSAPGGDVVEIGSTVVLRNLTSGAETVYTLVRSSEVNAAQGRISFQSPVGQALLRRRAGDEVEVAAPSGTLRFRIERVQG